MNYQPVINAIRALPPANPEEVAAVLAALANKVAVPVLVDALDDAHDIARGEVLEAA